MLDHVFTDAIGALRDAFEKAFLERQAFEERFQVDVLLGDITWETSYGLPGEGWPPRVQADLTLDWPTWSQSSYRTWYVEERLDEPPRIDIEVRLRVQRVAERPDPKLVVDALPAASPQIGNDTLRRSVPTLEVLYSEDLAELEYAVAISYDGTYELSEETLADGSSAALDDHFGAMGGWIASMLVRLGDLKFTYLPPEEEED